MRADERDMLSLRSSTIPSEGDLIRWSLDNPGFRFEYVNGETIVSPTGGLSGLQNSELSYKLTAWAKGNGYQTFGSSAGFAFGGLKVSPDEALLRVGRFSALSNDDKEKFVPLAPDVVVELVSKSQQYGLDRAEVQAKCEAMSRAGVAYVLMLDPYADVSGDSLRAWGEPPADFPTDWRDVLTV